MTFKYATSVSGISGATRSPEVIQAFVDANIEDDDVLGSIRAIDYLNKEFKVSARWRRSGRTSRTSKQSHSRRRTFLRRFLSFYRTPMSASARSVASDGQYHARSGLLHGNIAPDQDQGPRLPKPKVHGYVFNSKFGNVEHRDHEHRSQSA